TDVLVRVQFHHTRPTALVEPRDGKASRKTRGHVVRMALELGGEGEHLVVGEEFRTRRAGVPAGRAVARRRSPVAVPRARARRVRRGERPGGEDPGADRGRRGAEAAGVRDPVDAAEPDVAGLVDPHAVEGLPHRLDDEVVLALVELPRTLSFDADADAGVRPGARPSLGLVEGDLDLVV